MKVLTITKQPHADSVKIGIDWAKTSHHYCLRTLEGTTEFGSFEQDDEQIKQWIEGLSDRFKARRLTICMEDGRSALLHRLQRYETVDLFLVNTTTAARYRTTFTPSGDKNDPGDAASLLDLIERHPEKVRACGKVDSYAQALDQLCRARRAVVDRRTGTIASLREILELYYPLATKLFDEFSTSLALDFLQQWPDLQGLKNAEEATLVNFFHGHRCRSQKRIQERLKEIARYHCPIEEPVLLEVSRSCIIDHTNQIRALNESIQRYEQHIESLFPVPRKSNSVQRPSRSGQTTGTTPAGSLLPDRSSGCFTDANTGGHCTDPCPIRSNQQGLHASILSKVPEAELSRICRLLDKKFCLGQGVLRTSKGRQRAWLSCRQTCFGFQMDSYPGSLLEDR